MKVSRRAILAASVGAGQIALLRKYGLEGTARAATDGPTRLVVFYLGGGARIDTHFTPLSAEEIRKHIPIFAKDILSVEGALFTPEQVSDLAGSGGARPLRMAKLWNPSNPAELYNSATNRYYNRSGYSWDYFKLAGNTIAFHGIDHGSVAHTSAYTAAMSGLAGEGYRAPALVSIIANHF
jgi:hypothetical protein